MDPLKVQSPLETPAPARAAAAPSRAERDPAAIDTRDVFRGSARKASDGDGKFTAGRALMYGAKGFVLAPVLDLIDLGKGLVGAAKSGDKKALGGLALGLGSVVGLGALAVSFPLVGLGLAGVGLAMGGLRMAKGVQEVQKLRGAGEHDLAEERVEEIGRGAFGVASSGFAAYKTFSALRATRAAQGAAAAETVAGKPLTQGDFDGLVAGFKSRNEYLSEVVTQMKPEQRARVAQLLEQGLAPGYRTEASSQLLDDLASALPRVHRHASGGSSAVDFGSRRDLAAELLSEATRWQGGARLGGVTAYDGAFGRIQGELRGALQTGDRDAYTKLVGSLRPSLRDQGAHAFERGYTNGGVDAAWDFTKAGLDDAVVGGDAELLKGLTRFLKP